MANMKIGTRLRCSFALLTLLLEAAGIQVRHEYAAARDAMLAIEAAVSVFRLRQGPAVLAARPAPAVPRLLA